MANRRTLDEQIDLAQKELEQKEARVKELLGRRRSKEDKARTHRLCRRGGLLEKLFPGLAVITDEQFDVFVEKALLSGNAEKVLAELTPPPPTEPQGGADAPDSKPVQKSKNVTDEGLYNDTDAPKPTDAAAQGSTTPAQKPVGAAHSGRPANTPHNNGANSNGNRGDGARPTS